MAKVDDYETRLKAMVRYIEQDGHEKAEEIDVLAEEEYFMEKKTYLEQRIGAVRKYFDNLENKYKQQILLDVSKIKNQGYRDILSARNSVLEEVHTKVHARMSQLTDENNICLYKKVLFQLAIQGLVKIMEPEVIVQVRKKDVNIAKKVINQAQNYFTNKTGMASKLYVNENVFLSEKSSGGILMYTKSNSISLDNTLDLRLNLVGKSLLPFIREVLFGVNPNRTHRD